MAKNKVDCCQRIREGMAMMGWNQADLVRATGLKKSSVCYYVSGKILPRQDAIYALAKAFNVNEAWIMGYDVSPERREFSPDDAEKIATFGRKFVTLNSRDQAIIIDMMDAMIKRYSDLI